MTFTTPVRSSYRSWMSVLLFLVVAIGSGWTIAGPGLAWDEPAYRYSQVLLEEWLKELSNAKSFSEQMDLLSADAIDFYFEYNRPGPNFHPPMAGYLNLWTYGLAGSTLDDLSARRLASALELALTSALLCHVIARRYGAGAGIFAGLALATLPRVFGDSHIVGTDIPLMLFWTLAAFALLPAIDPDNHHCRRWQWIFSFLAGVLFLVKFSGTLLVLPLALVWTVNVGRSITRKQIVSWFLWSALFFLPMIPLALTILLGERDDIPPGFLRSMALFGMANATPLTFFLFWPLVLLTFYYLRKRYLATPLELPWVVLAVAPLVAIALNPSWWHDPVVSLARYFDLCLRRQGYLPDISIFYLGKQYIYSLPWHNAWVLMAVTLPWGILLLGVVGLTRAFAGARTDLFPAYLALNAFTLPIIRMVGTPAHDGVRLFLPTFSFWAGLAGLGALSIAKRFPSRVTWPLLFLVGPIWSAVEIARVHPYELAYYNVGLARAQKLGFEVTYWYDAVTPNVLAEMNERLPHGAALGFPSPFINPEVFLEHQSKGRLRADLELDVSKTTDFPYMLLLTHSAKATPYTKLLYAQQPWYESRHQGVRLFSIIDPPAVARAWALNAILLKSPINSADPPTNLLEERIFQIEETSIRRALDLLVQHRENALAHAQDSPPEVRELLERWTAGGIVKPEFDRVLNNPEALAQAAHWIAQRPEDLRILLQAEGYLAEEDFGGCLRTRESREARSHDRQSSQQNIDRREDATNRP